MGVIAHMTEDTLKGTLASMQAIQLAVTAPRNFQAAIDSLVAAIAIVDEKKQEAADAAKVIADATVVTAALINKQAAFDKSTADAQADIDKQNTILAANTMDLKAKQEATANFIVEQNDKLAASRSELTAIKASLDGQAILLAKREDAANIAIKSATERENAVTAREIAADARDAAITTREDKLRAMLTA